jgi:hypothetical protein
LLAAFGLAATLPGLRFTFDAASCNGGANRLCERFASPNSPFTSHNVDGEIVWAHPPYTKIDEWLEHYLACKAKRKQSK